MGAEISEREGMLHPLSKGIAGQLGEMGSIGEMGDDTALIVTWHGSGACLNGLVLCVKKGEHWDVQQFYETVYSHGGGKDTDPAFFSYDGKSITLYNAERKALTSIECGEVRRDQETAAAAKRQLGLACEAGWAWQLPKHKAIGRTLIREASAYGDREAKAILAKKTPQIFVGEALEDALDTLCGMKDVAEIKIDMGSGIAYKYGSVGYIVRLKGQEDAALHIYAERAHAGRINTLYPYVVERIELYHNWDSETAKPEKQRRYQQEQLSAFPQRSKRE